MMLSILLLLASQVQIEGLRADETWIEIAPGPSFYELDPDGQVRWMGGRVIDAVSRNPVAGARIELWSEEIAEGKLNAHRGGFELLDATTSGADGGFVIANLRSSKLRLTADGYSTLSGVGGDLIPEALIYPSTPPATLQFRDSDGRPIPDVLVTSTKTCSHDVPAFHLRADALGQVQLHHCGPQASVPDLRIRAAGYSGFEYYSARRVFANDSNGGAATEIYLPRHPAARVRMLDENGEPDAHRRFIAFDNECYHVLVSDSAGRLVFPGSYGASSLSIRPLHLGAGTTETPSLEHAPLLDFELTVRPHPSEWESDQATGRFRVVMANGDSIPDELGYEVVHPDGRQPQWQRDDPSERATEGLLPVGEYFLLIGRAFGTYALDALPFTVRESATTVVELRPERQPQVTVEWPEDGGGFWLEAGLFSVDDFLRKDDPVFLPAETPVAVHASIAGVPHILRFDQVQDGQVIRFPAAPPEASPPSHSSSPASQRIDVYFTDGSRYTEADISAEGEEHEVKTTYKWVNGQPEDRVHGPAGAWFRVTASERGYLPVSKRVRLPEVGAPEVEVRLVLEKRPELTIEGPAGWELSGWRAEQFSPNQGSRTLQLDPGPVQLLVRLADDRRYLLQLTAQANESRVIHIIDRTPEGE